MVVSRMVRRARTRRCRRLRVGKGRNAGRRRESRSATSPWTRTSTSSATSRASPTCCSTSTTAAAVSSATRLTIGSRSSTITGASPMLISSISRTRGRWTSARAMASICCSPPERVPAVMRRRMPSAGKRSMTSSIWPLRRTATRRFSCTVSALNNARSSGTSTMPACTAKSGRPRLTVLPPTRTSPFLLGSKPAIVLSKVVLPAPLGPSTARTVPAATVRSTGRTTVARP